MKLEDIKNLSNEDREKLSDLFLGAAERLQRGTAASHGNEGICLALREEAKRSNYPYGEASALLCEVFGKDAPSLCYWWGWPGYSTHDPITRERRQLNRRETRQQKEARIFACLLLREAFLNPEPEIAIPTRSCYPQGTTEYPLPKTIPTSFVAVRKGKIKAGDLVVHKDEQRIEWARGLVGCSVKRFSDTWDIFRHPSRVV